MEILTAAEALQLSMRAQLEDICGDFEISRVDTQFLLVLHPLPSEKDAVIEYLPEIIGRVESIVPLRQVWVNNDAFNPATIKQLFPISSQVKSFEEKARDQQMDLLFHYLARELTRDRSLFLISPTGVYLKAFLKQNADPPQAALEGASLIDILGISATAEILESAKRACSTGEEGSALYEAIINGELRHYAAKITPFGDCGQFLMSVVRLRK